MIAGLVAEQLGLRSAVAVTDYTALQVSMDLGGDARVTVEDMVLNEDPDLQFLMIWGQFFDHSWRVREEPAKTLLSAAGELNHAEQVRACFPLQAYRPRSEVEVFYDFYGL